MKTRFAPSPTGSIHLGNLRTALFSYLLAKSQHGKFLLRIEDTDKSRSNATSVEQLQADLHWAGLSWEEGPNAGGDHGPYFQSQRSAIYDHYYQTLIEEGIAYPCFCSDNALAVMRKIQLSQGKPPRYAGTCRNLTSESIKSKQQTSNPTLRFRVPLNQTIQFVDFVHGEQSFSTNDIGDFIIRRADGGSSFFFCNAIDDSLMGVTHILRAEDHLTNTPRQIIILQALKLRVPEYGHVSLVIETNNSPLSKREGSHSLRELREKGYLPAALQNYLARLGHHLSNNHCMTLEELAKNFSVQTLSKSPGRFDEAQLLFWQKQAIQTLDTESIWTWLGPSVQSHVPTAAKNSFAELVKSNFCFPEEALQWANILFTDLLTLSPEVIASLKNIDPKFVDVVSAAAQQHEHDFKAMITSIQQTLPAIKGRALFHPLRMILTGKPDGPEMVKIFELLGTRRIQKRLQNFSRLTLNAP